MGDRFTVLHMYLSVFSLILGNDYWVTQNNKHEPHQSESTAPSFLVLVVALPKQEVTDERVTAQKGYWGKQRRNQLETSFPLNSDINPH